MGAIGVEKAATVEFGGYRQDKKGENAHRDSRGFPA
jgi:hypothetical protein